MRPAFADPLPAGDSIIQRQAPKASQCAGPLCTGPLCTGPLSGQCGPLAPGRDGHATPAGTHPRPGVFRTRQWTCEIRVELLQQESHKLAALLIIAILTFSGVTSVSAGDA